MTKYFPTDSQYEWRGNPETNGTVAPPVIKSAMVATTAHFFRVFSWLRVATIASAFSGLSSESKIIPVVPSGAKAPLLFAGLIGPAKAVPLLQSF